MFVLSRNIVLILCCQLITVGCTGDFNSFFRVDAQATQTQQNWKPATYMGLTMGTSTRTDMLRVFGKPEHYAEYEKWDKETDSDVSDTIDFLYDNVGDFAGSSIVGVHRKRGIIMWIRVRPESMSREAVIRHFGPDYVITKYDSEKCIDDVDGVPIFESPTGSWELFEYRERGISFHVDRDGNVDEITFHTDPPGNTESKCRDQ